jgi:hypothetical protein
VDLNQETALRPVTVTMLESPRSDRLSTQLKTQILDKYRETGNLCAASVAVGVPYATARWHLEADPAFKEAVDGCHREFVERAKGYMIQHMSRPGNYMDRVTIARRFEPGVWGNEVNVRHSVDEKQVLGLADRAKTYAVDTTADVGPIGPESGGSSGGSLGPVGSTATP